MSKKDLNGWRHRPTHFENFRTISLECPLSNTRLEQPVSLNGKTYSALELKKRLKGGALFAAGSKFQGVNKADISL